MALLGAHVSVAGGPHTAFERGRDIGCDALQIFVKNANRWGGKALDEAVVSRFHDAHALHPQPVVAHASYLINLCSTKPETLEKSRVALADELDRCEALGVSGLVLHPGAHLGAGEEAGLDAIARSLDTVFAARDRGATRLLLENTAGQGTVLGARFEHLQAILERVDDPDRLAVCFDSCHAFAAGYDLRGEDGYGATIDAFEQSLGLARLALFHLNDSKFGLGSHKDRHENLGGGEIGPEAFARLAGDARFAATPMIVETPLGDDERGHERDLAALRGWLG